uniref:Uncharacterized protein n=1 Tax=Timema shepardi TaxID=629360 RepID=A0A7R9B680_TIMSH|nr:unnamed protein product [Timema shepardi]
MRSHCCLYLVVTIVLALGMPSYQDAVEDTPSWNIGTYTVKHHNEGPRGDIGDECTENNWSWDCLRSMVTPPESDSMPQETIRLSDSVELERVWDSSHTVTHMEHSRSTDYDGDLFSYLWETLRGFLRSWVLRLKPVPGMKTTMRYLQGEDDDYFQLHLEGTDDGASEARRSNEMSFLDGLHYGPHDVNYSIADS